METEEVKKVSCEHIVSRKWGDVGTLRKCFMDKITVINEQNVTISTRDESIGELRLWGNKKIFFLPVGVAEIFPNLLYYNAHFCAIKKITKENFHGLIKLQALYLAGNQIEMIPSDTFSDLRGLAVLDLSKKVFILLRSFKIFYFLRS